MENTLITVEEARTLGRPIGNNVSPAKILAFITEVERTIIRKTIGDSLYMKLQGLNDAEEQDERLNKLLCGGVYETEVTDCGIRQKAKKMFGGLKVTIAYYVYAQNVRAGDYESTRYGMVKKDDAYSEGITPAERSNIASSVSAIADSYLSECLEYCKDVGLINTVGKGSLRTATGCIIRKIG